MSGAPSADSTWWVGVLLEGTGAGLSASGKLMWRHAVTSRDPVRWYAIGGLLSMVLYPCLDTAAYAFTSQQILSASSGYIITFNVLGATVLLHETLTYGRAASVVVIVLGSAASVAFGNHLQYHYTASDYWNLLLQPTAVIYYVLLGSWLLFSAWLLLSRRGSQYLEAPMRPVLMASLGGSVAGNMWVTKVAMELLGCTTAATGCAIGVLMSTAGLLLVTVSIHLVSLALLAYGLRSGSALQLVTAYEASALLTSALSSALVLSEYTGMTAARLLLFYATGVVPIFLGLLLLASWPTKLLGDGERICLDTSGSGVDLACIEARLDRALDCGAHGGACAGLRRALRPLWARFGGGGGSSGGGGGGGDGGGGSPMGGGEAARRAGLPSEATKLLDGGSRAADPPLPPRRPTYTAVSWQEGLGGATPASMAGPAPSAGHAGAVNGPPNLDATGTTSGG